MNDQKLLLTHYKGKEAAFLLDNHQLSQVMFENATGCAIGDIYVGRVKNIVHGIGAAFVEYKTDHTVGFLPLADVKPKYILNRVAQDGLKNGDEILVQICKEPLKTKEATLTTDISFSGKYLVLIPLSRGVHYSKKLTADQKDRLWDIISDVIESLFGDKNVFLERYGLIVRTDAAMTEPMEITNELHELFHQASEMLSFADKRTVFSCLHKETSVFTKAIKNLFHFSVNHIVTDDSDLYSHIVSDENYSFIPKESIRLYDDPRISLIKLYGIEEKLREAMSKKVWLKGGGYLVIEPTEALTVIDVNSGKSSHAQNKMKREDFYHKVNTQAAEEAAHQLRLRNISGIIIIDFLKTGKEQMQTTLEQLKSLTQKDPVETRIVGITPLGLMEITRKKTEASLFEKMQQFAEKENSFHGTETPEKSS